MARREMTCCETTCENVGCAHHGRHKENAHCEGYCKRHPGAQCHPVKLEQPTENNPEEVP